jgi:hypothetical protein
MIFLEIHFFHFTRPGPGLRSAARFVMILVIVQNLQKRPNMVCEGQKGQKWSVRVKKTIKVRRGLPKLLYFKKRRNDGGGTTEEEQRRRKRKKEEEGRR